MADMSSFNFTEQVLTVSNKMQGFLGGRYSFAEVYFGADAYEMLTAVCFNGMKH